MGDHYKRTTCRLCNDSNLSLSLSLTPTPPANEFVPKEKLQEKQKEYPLDVYFCEKCFHVQLLDVVDPAILFRNYVYVSGTSPVFVKHFEEYSSALISKYHLKNKFVLEIGSNDGTMLGFFKKAQNKILGIDPAKKIAENATEKGIPTLGEFFNSTLAATILQKEGAADLIVANNVFAHIDDLSDVVKGVKTLLSPNGVFVFEVSYLLDVLEKTLFDTIYHEHLSYHSVIPLQTFFENFGMELIHCESIATHGGSLRVHVKVKKGTWTVEKSVNEFISKEGVFGLTSSDTIKAFGKKISDLNKTLSDLLVKLKAEGKKIVGFGAPAKATTLMYNFGFNKNMIEYIVDDSPLKQDLFSPGLHIPVYKSEKIYETKPDYCLILAWNFADSIIKNHEKFIQNGGKFIVPLPKVRVI